MMNDVNVYKIVNAVIDFDKELKQMGFKRERSVEVSGEVNGYNVDIVIYDPADQKDDE